LGGVFGLTKADFNVLKHVFNIRKTKLLILIHARYLEIWDVAE
jgi:hypothetical protein